MNKRTFSLSIPHLKVTLAANILQINAICIGTTIFPVTVSGLFFIRQKRG
jgi:hypothetical protein